MKKLKALNSNFLTGMLISFFDENIKISKTDLKVYFNMYKNSNERDIFEFGKFDDVKYLIDVDKHQFSKSIKKLISVNLIVKYDNNKIKLLKQAPF